jgi:Uma2 family endonuclease
MNFQPNLRVDKADFLARMTATEGRYEFAEGRVVMMVGASRAHGRIVRNLVVALHRRLDPAQWEVIAEFGLDAGPDTLRYPDIVVDRAGGGAEDHTATAPVLLAEVLSPATAETDLGDKAAEYLRIPCLLAYIILSQDEPKAWAWTRSAAEFTPAPAVIAGRGAIVRIPALQLELPLVELYAGIAMDRGDGRGLRWPSAEDFTDNTIGRD